MLCASSRTQSNTSYLNLLLKGMAQAWLMRLFLGGLLVNNANMNPTSPSAPVANQMPSPLEIVHAPSLYQAKCDIKAKAEIDTVTGQSTLSLLFLMTLSLLLFVFIESSKITIRMAVNTNTPRAIHMVSWRGIVPVSSL